MNLMKFRSYLFLFVIAFSLWIPTIDQTNAAQECEIVSAGWSASSARVGVPVNAFVQGRNCLNWEVSLNIKQEVTLGSDPTIRTVRGRIGGGPTLNIPVTFTSSDVSGGESISVYVEAIAGESKYENTSLAITVQGDPENSTYACVAANNKYACSPGGKSDCSDVPNGACAGKQCVRLGNPAMCGLGPNDSPGGSSVSFDFKYDNPLGGGEDNLLDLINTVARWIFNLAIPIAVIFIIYGGILFLTAGAYADGVKKGKEILKYAIMGLAIVFIGKGFVSLVMSIVKLGG